MESSAKKQPSGETARARTATDGLQEEVERVRADDVETLSGDVQRLAAEAREAALRATGAESIARRAVAERDAAAERAERAETSAAERIAAAEKSYEEKLEESRKELRARAEEKLKEAIAAMK
jgi:hypothetical protein